MTTRRSFLCALTTIALLTGNVAYAAEGAAKRITIYGDSNTWGYIPVESGATTRYPPDVRRPGVLQTALGSRYQVIDEGLSARTSDIPDPTLPHMSGAGLEP